MIHTFITSTGVRHWFPVIALLILSSSVWGQGVHAGSVDLSANVGFSNMTGIDGNKHINFGGSGGYNLSRYIAVLGEYSHLSLGSSASTGATVNENLQLFGAGTRLSFPVFRRLAPYVAVGVGVDRINASSGGVRVSSLTGTYVNGGGGASIYLSRHWGIRPEVRYEHLQFGVPQAHVPTTTVLTTTTGQNEVRATVSAFFQWGGKMRKK